MTCMSRSSLDDSFFSSSSALQLRPADKPLRKRLLLTNARYKPQNYRAEGFRHQAPRERTSPKICSIRSWQCLYNMMKFTSDAGKAASRSLASIKEERSKQMKRSKRKCAVALSWAAGLLHPSGHEVLFLHNRLRLAKWISQLLFTWTKLVKFISLHDRIHDIVAWHFLQVCSLWTMVMKLGSLSLWRQSNYGWGNEKTCIQDDYVNRSCKHPICSVYLTFLHWSYAQNLWALYLFICVQR